MEIRKDSSDIGDREIGVTVNLHAQYRLTHIPVSLSLSGWLLCVYLAQSSKWFKYYNAAFVKSSIL